MDILFIGGDKRMEYAANALLGDFSVRQYSGAAFPESKFSAAVLPLPFSKKDGEVFAPLSDKPIPFEIIPDLVGTGGIVFSGGENERLAKLCAENSLKLVNYFASEALTLKNAALTAEAACALLIESSEGSLLDSKVLISGYGRIGELLAARLKAFGCSVTVAARREAVRVKARLDGSYSTDFSEIMPRLSEFDFIANTVPCGLFGERELSEYTGVFLELASVPEYHGKVGGKYIYASGLPGKYSPKKAGEFIAEEIRSFCESLNLN